MWKVRLDTAAGTREREDGGVGDVCDSVERNEGKVLYPEEG